MTTSTTATATNKPDHGLDIRKSHIPWWSSAHSRGPGPAEAPQLPWPFSWSKFKAVPALKGRDGVLYILPSGSIIFVLWTAVLSTAPHPAAFPGSGPALATFGIVLIFSHSQLLWIGEFFVLVSNTCKIIDPVLISLPLRSSSSSSSAFCSVLFCLNLKSVN